MATEVQFNGKTICFMNEESYCAFEQLQAENERLKEKLSKQAILECQGRDRFIEELKQKLCSKCKKVADLSKP